MREWSAACGVSLALFCWTPCLSDPIAGTFFSKKIEGTPWTVLGQGSGSGMFCMFATELNGDDRVGFVDNMQGVLGLMIESDRWTFRNYGNSSSDFSVDYRVDFGKELASKAGGVGGGPIYQGALRVSVPQEHMILAYDFEPQLSKFAEILFAKRMLTEKALSESIIAGGFRGATGYSGDIWRGVSMSISIKGHNIAFKMDGFGIARKALKECIDESR